MSSPSGRRGGGAVAVRVQQVFFSGGAGAAAGAAVPGAGARSLAGGIRVVQRGEQLQHAA